ncbi:MAG: cyanophycinase [Bacteroidota bacterium]
MENTNASLLNKAPRFDVENGTYTVPQIITITSDLPEAKIVYKNVNDESFHEYFGPFVISQSSSILSYYKIGEEISEIAVLSLVINISDSKKGYALVAGGAEHCKELHQRVVELAGGVNFAKVAVVPTSSADSYTSAMDRYVRFKELADLKVDLSLIPSLNGKKDLSSINNTSRFWILPIAELDDTHTSPLPVDDLESPLEDESLFPNIDESTWAKNAFNKDIASKLRDENFNILFFTGGNQLRYVEAMFYPDGTESPVLSIIKYIYEHKGGVILGTSAGGAILSEHAIFGGSSFRSLRDGVIDFPVKPTDVTEEFTVYSKPDDARVWIGNGLGILPSNIVSDTHFIERGRLGRLLQACMFLKEKDGSNKIGIGADEDTAVVVHPDGSFEAIGATGALIIDVSDAISVKNDNQQTEIRNVVIHYIENGDILTVDHALGKVTAHNINSKKTQFIPYKDSDGISIESDIFGRDKIRNFLTQSLVYKDNDNALAFQINDNQYDSYDRMIADKVEEVGAMALNFHRNLDTAIYKGTLSYQWWGPGDSEYPRLSTTTEDDRFSFINVHLDIFSSDIKNYPDISKTSSVVSKYIHLIDGYSLDEWYDMFDAAKKYVLGVLVTPIKTGTIHIQSFFYDYAYWDRDNNDAYTPMKYIPQAGEEEYEDYDVIDIAAYSEVEIFIDGELAGKTDEKGQLIINFADDNKQHQFTAKYEKRKSYIIEDQINFPLKKSTIIFEKLVEEDSSEEERSNDE